MVNGTFLNEFHFKFGTGSRLMKILYEFIIFNGTFLSWINHSLNLNLKKINCIIFRLTLITLIFDLDAIRFLRIIQESSYNFQAFEKLFIVHFSSIIDYRFGRITISSYFRSIYLLKLRNK